MKKNAGIESFPARQGKFLLMICSVIQNNGDTGAGLWLPLVCIAECACEKKKSLLNGEKCSIIFTKLYMFTTIVLAVKSRRQLVGGNL